MPNITEVSEGVTIREEQQGAPITLANNSVDLKHINPASIAALSGHSAIVGSVADVSNNRATESSLESAILAASSGDSILILKSYIPSTGSTISITKKLKLVGQGHDTNITSVGQQLDIDVDYFWVESVRIQGTLNINNDGVFFNGWQATGLIVTDTGVGNSLNIFQE